MNRNEIITGSIGYIAQKNNQSIAESFLNCDCIVLIDVSGSMQNVDKSGKSRYDRACESLANLQNILPGKIAVVSFSDKVRFEPSGIPFFEGGTTDLTAGLRFIKIGDVQDMSFVVISDGQPDDRSSALAVAKTFKNKIDVIFVGDETDLDSIKFMNELAKVSGGKQITADCEKISEKVQYLLTS